MRWTKETFLQALVFATLGTGQTGKAFVVPPPSSVVGRTRIACLDKDASRSTKAFLAAAATEDCGCTAVEYSGEPSELAQKDLNFRQVVRNKSIYTIDGEAITMDDILGKPETSKNPSIVVFLRSLG